jgi:hypothetical protein
MITSTGQYNKANAIINMHNTRSSNAVYEQRDLPDSNPERKYEKILDKHHPICLDPFVITKKPSTGKENEDITIRMRRNQVFLTMEEIGNKIIEGHAISSAHFNDNLTRVENFRKSSVFIIDIDNHSKNRIPCQKMLSIFEKYGQSPALVYETLSSTDDWPKYRLIWQIRGDITDIRLWTLILKTLAWFCPTGSIDKNALSVHMRFLPGKKIVFANYDQYLDLGHLLQRSVFDCLSDKSGKGRQIVRDMKKYCQNVGVNMKNDLPDIEFFDNRTIRDLSQLSQPLIYINSGCGVCDIFHINFTAAKLQRIKTEHIKIRYIKPEDLYPKCKLYREYSEYR